MSHNFAVHISLYYDYIFGHFLAVRLQRVGLGGPLCGSRENYFGVQEALKTPIGP